MMADQPEMLGDTWDDMRAHHFDDYDASGQPNESLDNLLGSLGVYGKPKDKQVAAVKEWLDSAPAQAAPPYLLIKARGFVAY